MRVFLLACLTAVVLGAGAAYVLNSGVLPQRLVGRCSRRRACGSDPPVIREAERSEAIRDLVTQSSQGPGSERLRAFGAHRSGRDDRWELTRQRSASPRRRPASSRRICAPVPLQPALARRRGRASRAWRSPPHRATRRPCDRQARRHPGPWSPAPPAARPGASRMSARRCMVQSLATMPPSTRSTDLAAAAQSPRMASRRSRV